MCHIFFIHSNVNGHLCYFNVLAIVNSAAMNIGIDVSFCIMVFSRSGVAGSYGSSIFSFYKNFHTLLHSVLVFCVLSHSVMSISCGSIDCSLHGYSVHGILQGRILEWIPLLSRCTNLQSHQQCRKESFPICPPNNLTISITTRKQGPFMYEGKHSSQIMCHLWPRLYLDNHIKNIEPQHLMGQEDLILLCCRTQSIEKSSMVIE